MERKKESCIVVAEQGEYGKRLVDYLEKELSDRARLLLFTDAEKLADWEGEADYYIMGRLRGDRDGLEEYRSAKVICLTDDEEEAGFCRYDKPEKLRDMIRGCMDAPVEKETRITLILSPVPVEDMAGLALHYMEAGGLYLGAEDIGSDTDRKADMGDLCYFIHLHEENILSRLREMAREEEGCYFLDSPDLYFYLREITADDYRWFFDRIREADDYQDLVIGAGIGFLDDPDLLRLFDRLILLDSREDPRIHRFCERIGRIVREDYYAAGLELIIDQLR